MTDTPLPQDELEILIKKGLARLSIEPSADQVKQYMTYINEVEQWNRRMNLVKATGRTLVIKHLFDSLAGAPFFFRADRRNTICDVGSGAGFPGIPLAIAMPDSNFILSERVGKKAGFLQNALLCTGLKNVEVFGHNFRDIDKKVDIITFRAFSAIVKVLDDMLGLLHPGGCIIAYKGQRLKIDEEVQDIQKRKHKKPIYIEVHKVDVPFLDNERHMVIITV
jgi:16S rRNA (guanine527-N7)-methyltransferase